jgi:hypothetical protein
MQEVLDAGLFRVLQPKRWGGHELPELKQKWCSPA